MKKFCVIGDSTNKPRFSSHVIVSSLNEAAKKFGLFDENGIVIKYDCVCNTHGDKVDAFICTYELSFPEIILDNAANRPIIGVSRDNERFICEGGYSKDLASHISLGVDSTLWQPIRKTNDLDRFCVGVYTESLVRGGVELALSAFIKAFSGNKNAVLKIKDRNATSAFESWIKQHIRDFDVNIEYINDNWSVSQVNDWLKGIDCHLYLNRSSTFAMPPLELMASGIPTIIIPYSGPRDYCDNTNSLLVDYQIENVYKDLDFLTAIGCRNFFFSYGYKEYPVWAKADISSIANKMLVLYENRDNIKGSLSNNAINTARNMTWEKSAENLGKLLTKWF